MEAPPVIAKRDILVDEESEQLQCDVVMAVSATQDESNTM